MVTELGYQMLNNTVKFFSLSDNGPGVIAQSHAIAQA